MVGTAISSNATLFNGKPPSFYVYNGGTNLYDWRGATGSGTSSDPYVYSTNPTLVDGSWYELGDGLYHRFANVFDLNANNIAVTGGKAGAIIQAGHGGTGANSVLRMRYNGAGIWNHIILDNLIIDGTPGSGGTPQVGVWEEATQRGEYHNIRVRNVTDKAWAAYWTNYNQYSLVKVDNHVDDNSPRPDYGLWLDARVAPDMGGVYGGNFTVGVFENCSGSGVGLDGITFANAKNCKVIGGVCGDNQRHGVVVNGVSQDIDIDSMDNEDNNLGNFTGTNAGSDFRVIAGATNVTIRNSLGQVNSARSIKIAGDNCTVDRGSYASLEIVAGAHNTELRGPLLAYQTGAGLIDNGTNTWGFYYLYSDPTTRIVI